MMRNRTRFVAAAALAAATLATTISPAAGDPPAAAGTAVIEWNAIAVDTVLADSRTRTPSASSLYVAIAQAAVYNATMAIERTHALYESSLRAPRRASVEAAVAAAARGVLVEYFPAQQPALDTAYTAALATVDDGRAEDEGVAIGEAAAAEMVARRETDGRFASVPEPPDGDEPGEWRRTSPGASVTPWTASVTPFLVRSPEQFRPDGPNALTSSEYAQQWDEVRRLGARTGSQRTAEQTEIARFWSDNTVGQFNRALRGLALERGLTNGQAARLFAMTSLTGADAMITCWSTKYHYSFWRPITAIRLADTDGNPATTADPAWEPFSTTANHPEYTSGHACLTGAVSRALREFLGTSHIELTIDAAVADTTVHHFATVEDLRTEVENARIYGGDHFRLGGSDGTESGDAVARWALRRFFQPVG